MSRWRDEQSKLARKLNQELDWIRSVVAAKDPKAASIFAAMAPVGAPPPLGDRDFQ